MNKFKVGDLVRYKSDKYEIIAIIKGMNGKEYKFLYIKNNYSPFYINKNYNYTICTADKLYKKIGPLSRLTKILYEL
jgi:hypothetical protein